MSSTQDTSERFLENLNHLVFHEHMMFKPMYQFSAITTNHHLMASDIIIYNRVTTTFQEVLNTFSDTPHKWTEIYEHLVGIQDTCRLRLTEEYWNKFEACLHYVRAKLPKSIPELLAALRIHVNNFR
jgi:hypothetical protein